MAGILWNDQVNNFETLLCMFCNNKLIDGNTSKLFNCSIICMVYKLVNNVLLSGTSTYLLYRLHAQNANPNLDSIQIIIN